MPSQVVATYGGTMAEALLQLPVIPLRDDDGAPQSLWVTVGLLALDGIALQLKLKRSTKVRSVGRVAAGVLGESALKRIACCRQPSAREWTGLGLHTMLQAVRSQCGRRAARAAERLGWVQPTTALLILDQRDLHQVYLQMRLMCVKAELWQVQYAMSAPVVLVRPYLITTLVVAVVLAVLTLRLHKPHEAQWAAVRSTARGTLW